MADQRWETNIPEFRLFRDNWYICVFEGADYESVIGFSEFKMADENPRILSFFVIIGS